jgi:hypothetical protein
MTARAFAGPCDAGSCKSSADAAELYVAEAAARTVIDGCCNVESLRKRSVSETAENSLVQSILCAAMAAYVATLPKGKQHFFAHLTQMASFGLEGGCRQVSPVFGYLLNSIHGGKVTTVARLHGHAMLATVPIADDFTLYIDATWRQGEEKSAQKKRRVPDPRERLPMVRVSFEKPDLRALNLAVTEALSRLRGEEGCH